MENLAPLMFLGLVAFLLLGYPVAFALAANGLLFAGIGIAAGHFDVSLLHALGFAEDVVNAIADHDRLRASPAKGLRSLGDVVYVANALAGAHFEWTGLDLSAPTLADLGLEERYGELRPAIESEAQALLATLT